MSAELLEVKDLQVSFQVERGVKTEALKGVSFCVPENTTVALVGESGSGKSVSAMAILGLLPANALVGGQIRLAGRSLLDASAAELRALRGAQVSMIFQEPMSSLNPVFTVGEQIAEVLRLHLRLTARAARARAVQLLDEVGIPEPALRARSYPHELSGGQQQRVMIAMAIACEPRLLIADEPTTALDVTIQAQILELLRRLQRERRMSMLFITHDLSVVGELAEQVVVMRNGLVLEQGRTLEVFARPMHPYTRALLACRPSLTSRPRHLPVIADFLNDDPDSPARRLFGAGGPPGAVLAGASAPDGVLFVVPRIEQRERGLSDADPVVLDVRGLVKTFTLNDGLFSRRQVHAVRDVSFKLRRGKTLGLVGESGSGKTTVGLSLLRLHQADAGQVLFDGVDLQSLSSQQWFAYRRRLQIIFQNPYASLNPRFTVGQTLVEPMRIHAIGDDDARRIQRARELLDRVGLPADSLTRYPHEFSGGQRQRIAIARVLTLDPEVVVCDESVSALDVSVQAQVLNLLQDLQDEFGLSYLFISHDLAVVRYLADEVMVMKDGAVIEAAGSDQIYREPREEYTRRLLGAIPRGLAARVA
ncbi:MAG: ABC transporter ATP-binding protein [Burkholderiaceae bacterium]|nr:ABC transporter ATP-binding protein [Burkholderiaceae bacterium]